MNQVTKYTDTTNIPAGFNEVEVRSVIYRKTEAPVVHAEYDYSDYEQPTQSNSGTAVLVVGLVFGFITLAVLIFEKVAEIATDLTQAGTATVLVAGVLVAGIAYLVRLLYGVIKP
ncbi:hypothetical protein [Thiothrix fructosivorans]|uniref:Uncharacterized protein n=1 Tax=Thiothrix fructosivorans TaxID=111770 RepID=A0A8B0SF19_9GAMM|nr:hypothetical protein [Thiothrix fructosivorans]MBO0611687.1 hypothetical protein [Thiothrix fructosivorans]QTX10653.1 hypothetical protein J1836_019145 [Thiothrix fructosivorans]